jgi:hypothetical protein
MLCGSFEGQTNYLKQKALFPHIAGIILELKINDKNKVYQVGYKPIYFEEIKEDWNNYDMPEIEDFGIDNEAQELMGYVLEGISEPPEEEDGSSTGKN